MVWGMPLNSFLFFYVLPWGSFVLVLIYGIIWTLSGKRDSRDHKE
ncbi:hypothetical protein [uncultured Anaerotruncus sp.]|nr:hypothetical protein [uncultured Anaerotruncus sp.]